MNTKKVKLPGSRKSLLTSASVLAAAAAAITATPAMAQDAEEEEAIVVTGTRLVRQDFEAISPITTVGAEQLELTATLTTESLLNELPQIVPGNTITSNNVGGEDFATVDLRGLGINRTLVLVNGERVPGSSTLGTVDLATIPASMISRVEVVTGGASAVYGSDAVAGVINFVLKDDYEGAEINTTYRAEMETGNAAVFEINGLVGGNFANGRGNITAYASYFTRDSVLQSDYDFSRVSGGVCYDAARGLDSAYYICDSVEEARANVNGGPFNGLQGGSSTPPWGLVVNDPLNRFQAAAGPNPLNTNPNAGPFFGGTFASYDHDCNPATPNVAYSGAGTVGDLSFDPSGSLTPRRNRGACGIPDRTVGSSQYNFAPDNYMVLPAERISLTTNGHYDISDDVRLNFLINYTNSRQQIQLAPTPATGLVITLTPNMRNLIQLGPDGVNGNADDHDDLWAALQSRPAPYAPFTMSRRTTELGTRNQLSENNAFYFLTSLEGGLGENWDWALTASYGQTHFLNRTLHNANRGRFLLGLAGCQALTPGADNTLFTADDGGVAPPTGFGSSTIPCVPIDIFGAGSLDAGMLAYLDTTTFSETIVEENRLTGYVRGDLFELPAGPVAAVFGFEYRDSQFEFHVDNEQRLGNIYGFNAQQDQLGAVDVYELYTEVAVPIVSEAPFAHYLGLEAGFRRSNYSTVGNVDTYKIGGEWAPTEWLRFRAMFNEATRAPNVFELFQAGDQGFSTTSDPCRDSAGGGNGVPDVAGVTVAECTASGVPLASYPGFAQINAQIQGFSFGNPNLRPETAESLTYGIVFQPNWFPVGDFRATADYYEVEVSDVILGLGVAFYLNDCYVNNNPASCARVSRLPTGQVDFVNTNIANQAVLATSGVDFQFEWSVPIGPGQLTVNELYSMLDEFRVNTTDFVGTTSAGIGGAFPDYKSVLSVSYNVGDWTFFGRWFHTPEVVSSQINGFGSNTDALPTTPTTSPAANYFDLSARWAITDSFSITGVISNVTDEYPPQTADGFAGQGNVDVALYPRPLGREFAISGRYRF